MHEVFLTLNLVSDSEANQNTQYILTLGQIQYTLQEYGIRLYTEQWMEPKEYRHEGLESSSVVRRRSLRTVKHLLKGPFQVILSNTMTVKLIGVDSWLQVSNIKPAISNQDSLEA